MASPVHPHACGERAHQRPKAQCCRGSSPRMWGTVDLCGQIGLVHRFIPTHVGNGFACSRSRQQATVHPHACGERPAARSGTCHAAVHPHACGERWPVARPTVMSVGSSPRMWGTAGQQRAQRQQRRFIPTHVGNGSAGSAGKPHAPVHPHACGERVGARPEQRLVAGSSPRMWGTVAGRCKTPPLSRFIPTHVGNGPCAGTGSDCRPVHPHACGERPSPHAAGGLRAGSSPRMWGTED